MDFSFIENLMDSDLSNAEILQEVESRFSLNRQEALNAIKQVCDQYADGAPDAVLSHKQAGNLAYWASVQIA